MEKQEEKFRQIIDEAVSTKEKIFLSAIDLFSRKGYEKVGIRELCRSVNIKESSFYNHFSNKEKLLQEIFSYYMENNVKTILSVEEINAYGELQDVKKFFEAIMMKFRSITNNPVFHTVRRIVAMESYTNEEAGKLALRNLLQIRGESTIIALEKMRDKGYVGDCDIRQVVSEYYYGLMGLLDEMLLQELWEEKMDEFDKKIRKHIDFYADFLKIK